MLTMSLNELASMLKDTEKGKLQYGKSSVYWHSTPKQPPILRKSFGRSVFAMSDMLAALETCDECACATEALQEEQERMEVFKIELEKSQDDKLLNRTGVAEISYVDQEVFTIVRSVCDASITSRRDAVDNKTRLYEDNSLELSKTAERGLAAVQEKQKRHIALQLERFKKYEAECEEDNKQIVKHNTEQHKSRDKILRTRIEDAENRRLQKLQQGLERLQRGEAILAECGECRGSIRRQLQQTGDASFARESSVSSLMREVENHYIGALTLVEEGRNKQGLEQSELNDMSETHQALVRLSGSLQALLKNLQIASERREVERQELEKAEEARAATRERAEKAEKDKKQAEKNPEFSLPDVPKELRLSVSRSAYHNHLRLKKLLAEYEEASKRFTGDKTNMKTIMAINKAISLPISSITNRAGSDVKNTLADLNAVLKGRSIKVGSQNVSLSEDAEKYACLFMAKKFVKQAEGQVSSNHSAAFSLALTVLGVWCEYDVFGDVFSAQMQSRCPFVVPWYIPQLPGQSDKDYNKLRGYLYTDDESVEGQDKYLSRMSGVIRTYAALLQSPLPPGAKQHPHGIPEGWKWLARMLNLDPWPEVTSTVLYDFLTVCGHALMRSYGRQFQKLLYILCHDYYPKIEEISGGGDGPLQRLQMFLKDCIKSKDVPKPEGLLEEDFWSTYHHTGVVGS